MQRTPELHQKAERTSVRVPELEAERMLSAILLTSSLLLVVGMVSALMWLSATRGPVEQAAVPVETDELA